MKRTPIELYIVAVFAAAVAALALSSTAGLSERIGSLLALQALALITAMFVVGIPRLQVEVTTSHFFILIGLAVLGPLGGILVGAAGVVGATLGKPGGSKPSRMVFNLCEICLASAAAAAIFSLAGGRPEQAIGESMGPLFLANLVFLILNSGLVAIAITLDKRVALATTLPRCLRVILVPYLVGLVFAICVLAVFHLSVTGALALALPPCWVLIAMHRMTGTRAIRTDQDA